VSGCECGPAAARGPGPDAEAGVTIIELLVSPVIMSVVMAVSTTTLVGMYRSANAIDARADAQTQISLALLRLDKQVRYAKGIGEPHLVGDSQYVELEITTTAGTRCLQLRVTGAGQPSGGQLQQRTWTPATTPPPTWTTLASGVTSPRPFRYVPVTDSVSHQRLETRLTSVSGGGSRRVSKDSDITFTAHNTDRLTETNVCLEWIGSTP
jgi:type II secretory pathway component PulJ